MTHYTLTRRLPSGEEKAHVTDFPNRREAAKAAMFVLTDNAGATRGEANRAASRVQNAPLGAWTPAHGGYFFRIDLA